MFTYYLILFIYSVILILFSYFNYSEIITYYYSYLVIQLF